MPYALQCQSTLNEAPLFFLSFQWLSLAAIRQAQPQVHQHRRHHRDSEYAGPW